MSTAIGSRSDTLCHGLFSSTVLASRFAPCRGSVMLHLLCGEGGQPTIRPETHDFDNGKPQIVDVSSLHFPVVAVTLDSRIAYPSQLAKAVVVLLQRLHPGIGSLQGIPHYAERVAITLAVDEAHLASAQLLAQDACLLQHLLGVSHREPLEASRAAYSASNDVQPTGGTAP